MLFPPAQHFGKLQKVQVTEDQHSLRHGESTLRCYRYNPKHTLSDIHQLKQKLEIPDSLLLRTCNKETTACPAFVLCHPKLCWQPGTFFSFISFLGNPLAGEDMRKMLADRTYLYRIPAWDSPCRRRRRGRACGRPVLAGEQLRAAPRGRRARLSSCSGQA